MNNKRQHYTILKNSQSCNTNHAWKVMEKYVMDAQYKFVASRTPTLGLGDRI